MARRVAVIIVLALALATAGTGPASALDLIPADLTIAGPSAVSTGDTVDFTGELTFLGAPVPFTTVELWVDGIESSTDLTGPLGDYTLPHTFVVPGVRTVQARVDGVFVGSSPELLVAVGSHVLTVLKTGTGLGTVTSVPAGIDCGGDCGEAYPHGTSVDLTAAAAPGNVFSGWTGACSGTGTCTVSMTAARTVTAGFIDVAPPGVPVLTGTTPASPSNDNDPTLHGTAQPGSTVRAYSVAGCGGPVLGSAIAHGGSFSIPVTVPSNSTTTFYVDASDAAGTGPCSSGLTYVEDSIAPGAPLLTGTAPASPANNNNPSVLGTADPGTTIRIYTNNTCTSAVAGSGSTPSGSFAIPASVPDNTTVAFHATATDQAGNTSLCSAGILYTEDSLGPPAPVLTGTTPNSPADNNSPTVHGTSDPGATIRIFLNSNCTGAIAAITTASGAGTFSATVTVPDDATSVLRATAQDAALNTSACSSPLNYVEDSSAPASPSITGSDPSPPANNNTPSILGVSEPGSLVRLFDNSGCAGAPLTGGTATAGGTFSIPVNVTDDSSTTFYVNAEDSLGHISTCSAGFTYVEDSTGPGPVIWTGTVPASPANENMPHLHGLTEAGAQVRVFTNSSCSGSPPWADRANPATGGAFSTQVNVPDNSTTTFYAYAIDGAGNPGPCSAGITYVEDSSAPAAPTLTGTSPGSPANDNTPDVLGTSEAGAIVQLYTGAGCTSPIGPATVSGGAFSINVMVADDTTTTFRATATDAAGNTSPCSSGLTYIEKTTVAPPVITGSLPGSPANANNPLIQGTAEAGATVTLYTLPTCTGASVSGTAPGGTFSIAVVVGDNSTTTFYGTTTDVALNTSACSSGFTYVEDSSPPGPPVLTHTTPASPANNNQPHVHGTAEPGADVFLFTNATCSGSPPWADTANPATGGAFSTQVNVPDNSTTTFYAIAVDAAGNASACSAGITYTEVSP